VADDNPTSRRLLHDLLTPLGLRPTLVADGEAALATITAAAAAGTPFPLVLLDAQMPGVDGFTVASRIQQNPQLAGAVLMMLTAAGLRGDAARCRALGIAAYLTKPIPPADLWEAIRLVLGTPAKALQSAPTVTRHVLRQRRRPQRILVAEDQPVNRKLACHLLEKRGFTVVAVEDGQAALDALAGESFDLVLMDVDMPVMDGLQATAAIRALEQDTGRHLPILAMTAHAMTGDCERCLAAGMDGYVAKPVKAADLDAAIQQLLVERHSNAPDLLEIEPAQTCS
jgi:CheY-like chemotaxis protein